MIYSINMNFSETAPSTDVNLQQCFLLSVVVLMVYFDICSLIMFQSKKKEKEKTRWIGNSSCTTQQCAL